MRRKPNRRKPNNDKRTRADELTAELRIQEILQIKLDGAQAWDIFQYVSDKEDKDEPPWVMAADRKHMTERNIRNYMAKADERIKEECQQDNEAAIRRHLAQRRNLYAKAVSQGDVGVALSVLRDEATLQGLYPATKTESKITGGLALEVAEEIVDSDTTEDDQANNQTA